MRRRLTALFVLATACGGAPPKVKDIRVDALQRIDDATAIVHGLRSLADGAIPRGIAQGAHCVAVVPGLVHGGLVVGARAGSGVVTCRDHGVWRAPTFFSLSGADVGITMGFQRVDVVMLVMTDGGESALLEGSLRLGAQGALTAGPIGRDAEAATDVALRAPILYYARTTGLFIGLDFAGTSLDRDEGATRAVYGDPRDVGALVRGAPLIPAPVTRFLDEVARTFNTR